MINKSLSFKEVRDKMKKLLISLFLVFLVSLSIASAAKTGLTDDFNRDGTVDYKDYFLFYDHMNTKSKDYTTWDQRYDLVKDGKVDHKDSLEFARVFQLYNQGTIVKLLEELDLKTISTRSDKERLRISEENANLRKNILLELDKLKYKPANSNTDELNKERKKIVNVLLNHFFYELNAENQDLTLKIIEDIGTVEDVILAQNIRLLLYGENMDVRINAAKNLGQLGDKRAIDALDSLVYYSLKGEDRAYNWPSFDLAAGCRDSSKALKRLRN